jgi:YD repeat-containing protein
LGRLIERRNADGSVERWEYDAEGNEVLYVDGDGGEHRKEYVSWNLLHRETDPAGNTRTFQYSPTEKITQFVDAGGMVHDFKYDKKDRLVEVWRNGTRHDINRYDEADNLIEKLDGDGRVENEFAYGELISTTVFGKFVTKYRSRYDGSVNITDPTGRTHTFYFSDDGLILKELANGTRELSQYDAKGGCLRKVVSSADGAGKFTIDYGYDDVSDFSLAPQRRENWIKKYIGENTKIDWK